MPPLFLFSPQAVLTAATLPVYAAGDGDTPPPPQAKSAAKTAPLPAGKFLLAYKAQAGQVKRTKSAVTMIADLGDKKSTRQSKDTSKVTYTKVDAATGDLTAEDKDETSESTVDGEKEEADKPQTVTTVYPLQRPSGVIQIDRR